MAVVSGEPNIRANFSESFEGIKLTLDSGISGGRFSVKVHEPLTTSKIGKHEFCIKCAKKQTKMSTLTAQVIISFMYAKEPESPTLKSVITKKLTIPGRLLFNQLFS